MKPSMVEFIKQGNENSEVPCLFSDETEHDEIITHLCAEALRVCAGTGE
jgi:hypothetical protein